MTKRVKENLGIMQRFVIRFKSEAKGFTLIELLVAMAILGIMSAVTIPQVSKFLQSASSKAATIELSLVQVAVVGYQCDHVGAIPVTADLVADITPYISDALKGTYTISAGGVVAQTGYPGT